MKIKISVSRGAVVLDLRLTESDAAALADIIQYAGRADLHDAASHRMFGRLVAFVEHCGETAYVQHADPLAERSRATFAAEIEQVEAAWFAKSLAKVARARARSVPDQKVPHE